MNLKNFVSKKEIKQNINQYKKIFFYRICGTGMGTAAALLKEKGLIVEGADNQFFPPMSDYLNSTGISVFKLKDVDKEFLQQYDLIVVGNVVPRGSDDALKIEDSNIPFTSFPDILGAMILSEQNVVGISGTHGKTSTTYLMLQIFNKLGFRPGYFIGGVLDGGASGELGDNSYFFIESDEYDSAYFQKISKFRLYEIDHLILTSLEFDHADIFSSIEEIEDQFESIIPHISKSILTNTDYESANKMHKLATEKSLRSLNRIIGEYGLESQAGPLDIVVNEKGSTFKLNINGVKHGFKTNLVGEHNVLNLTSCILFAVSQNIDVAKIKGALNNLLLPKRRQERRGKYKKSIIVDDFAHHPRAVKVTLNSLKVRYPKHKILTIFEPNSATARSNIFQKEFASALSETDQLIIIKPSRKSTAKNSGDLDCDRLLQDIKEIRGQDFVSVIVNDLSDLRSLLEKYCADESFIVAILSNSTCLGLWESSFIDDLKKD